MTQTSRWIESMTDAMRERPAPYIQNHVSWCWATAAKIVGFHFLIKEITGQTEQTIFIMVKVLKYFIPIDLMVKQ